ncbi:hypothetical protein PLESTF_000712200 [Pleodorina starrii]|nr:hypothetical protein PLESTM_001801200 [Pleodorina starrii]GLC68594.1 hypothetical protein PLESTF_000712200 [Pleodorina starrii]
MQRALTSPALPKCSAIAVHRQRHRVAFPVSTRSGMREEVDILNAGKSPVEELAGETNTMVTDVMDIDRTPELLAWVFSGIFGRSKQPAASPPPSDQTTTVPSAPPLLASATSNSSVASSEPASSPPAPTPSPSPSTSRANDALAESTTTTTTTAADPAGASPAGSSSGSGTTELATVGGGCFWCTEACFRELQGVMSVTSGYAGGHVANPTYQQVCSKTTGHAEVVQIKYDPAVLSYRDILQIFMSTHDPTTPNRSGNDVGPQYRSIILTHDPRQAAVAAEVVAEANRGLWFGRRVCTEVAPLREFYPAESVHQRYYSRNPGAGYCVFVVQPKLQEFRRKYAKRLRKDANLPAASL